LEGRKEMVKQEMRERNRRGNKHSKVQRERKRNAEEKVEKRK